MPDRTRHTPATTPPPRCTTPSQPHTTMCDPATRRRLLGTETAGSTPPDTESDELRARDSAAESFHMRARRSGNSSAGNRRRANWAQAELGAERTGEGRAASTWNARVPTGIPVHDRGHNSCGRRRPSRRHADDPCHPPRALRRCAADTESPTSEPSRGRHTTLPVNRRSGGATPRRHAPTSRTTGPDIVVAGPSPASDDQLRARTTVCRSRPSPSDSEW